MKKTIINPEILAQFTKTAHQLPERFNAPAAGLTGATAKQYARIGLLDVVGSEPYTFTDPNGEQHEGTRNLYALKYGRRSAEEAWYLLNAKTTRHTADGGIIYYVAE